MEAVEYLKAKGRMTNTCNIGCNNCLLSTQNNGKNLDCSNFENEFPELAVEAVEQWANEHPVKTYLSVLLEKFPKAFLRKEDGTPTSCPHKLFSGEGWDKCGCICNCKDCWNREYKEEE